jgi:DNA-binding MarR family transcriptional regulator
LGRNILPLQRDGLITVKPSAFDRRSKELSLSTAGEKLYREARKYWLEAQAEFEATFGDKRAFDLRVMLKDLVTGEVGAAFVHT